MDDTEILTDEELQQRQAAKSSALDESDLAGIDAEAAQRDNALKAALRQGVTINADDAARMKAISSITGIPTDVVGRNKEAAGAQARVLELQRVLADSPILARQMTDPEFAKLAHDDAENLSAFEKTFRTYLGASAKSGVENLLGTAAKVVDKIQPFTTSEDEAAALFKDNPAKLKDFLENSPSTFLTRFARAMQQASQVTMENVNPDARADYGSLKYATTDPTRAAYLSPIKVVGDTLQSLSTTLALAASTYLTKGVANRVEAQALAAGMSEELARKAAIHAAAETMARLGAATEGTAGFGQQAIQTREQADLIPDSVLQQSADYQRLVASGWSPEAARLVLSAQGADLAGAAGGVVDAITNFYGGRILGRIIGEGGPVLPRVAKGFATEGTQEAVQSGLEQIGQNVAVQKFLDPHQDLLDGVAEQIAMGFTVGGTMGGAFGVAAGRHAKMEAAQRQHDALKKIFELAGMDKLRERNPEEFAKFVQATAEETGTSALYVDAKVFAQAAQQAGLDVQAAMPETAKQMREALATGGDVRIPIGEATAALPGTGMENVLMQHLRTSPDAPTLAETQNKQFVEETQAAVERAMAEHDFNTVQKESAKVVENELYAQLERANRFTKDVNTAYARLMSTFYTVQAARLGISPEEMYVRYPLRIESEAVVGPRTMEQERTKFEEWSKGAPVINHDQMFDTYQGGPAVFRVFHGTTGDFEAFDLTHASPESDLGAGIYTTNNTEEVSENYAGEGPDLTAKIESRADQIIGEMKEQPQYGTPAYKKAMAAARRKARKELKVKHGGMVMPVYVNLQNPALLGGPNGGTYLDAEPVYADPNDPESDIEDFKGTLVTFIENVEKVAQKYDHDKGMLDVLDQLREGLYEGGMPLLEAVNRLTADEKFGYISDDKGRLVSKEVIREALERTGFDGIVDYTVNKKFGSEKRVGRAMKGMHPETAHVIAFKPTQVKSAIGNIGTYDPNNPSTLKQEGVASANGEENGQDAARDLDFTATTAGARPVVFRTLGGGNAEQGWAEATRIRRKDGKPATVYRGAGRALSPDDFAAEALGVASGNASSGLGVWFTISPEEARSYGNVEGFHLDIRNPLVVPVDELPGFDSVAEAAAWREGVRRQGYDGLLVTAKHLGGRTHLVAFEPKQVIHPEKTFAQDTIENATGEVLPNPPFYSALSMQVAAAKMNVAPAAQWKAFINSLASKGVKKDEITLSGVMDWLDLRESMVKDAAARAANKALPQKRDTIEVGGKSLREFLGPDVPPIVVVKLHSALLKAMETSRNYVTPNMRDAQLDLMEQFKNTQQDMRNEASVAFERSLRSAFERVKAAEADLKMTSREIPPGTWQLVDENGDAIAQGDYLSKENWEKQQLQPGVKIVKYEPKAEDLRVTKQEVIDYLAKNGVQAQTAILGAPKEEQEGYKPLAAPAPVEPSKIPEGFQITHSMTTGRYIVRAPDGAVNQREETEQAAIAWAQQYAHAANNLPELPPGYELTEQDGNHYVVQTEDGDTLEALSRAAIMRKINEHYQENNSGGEPSDEEVEERAREMFDADLPEMARQYASESDYANATFNVAIRPPAYRVEKVEGSRGIRDLFTGRETPEHYRVVKTEFSDLPADDDVQDDASGNTRDRHGMPDDADEFWEMFGDDAEEEPVDKEFPTEEAAREWAEQNVGPGEPKWLLWDSETTRDAERDNEGEFEDFADARSHADSVRSARYESEVEYYQTDYAEELFDSDREHYMDRARRDLEEDRQPRPWYTRQQIERPLVGNYEAPVGEEEQRLRLKHKNQYQSDGGENYRELVIGVPNIEAYNASDTTHFGHVFGGRTIAWARVKEHLTDKGERVLFVEEVQSQRAQHGREEGFKPASAAQLQERLMAINNELEALANNRDPVTNVMRDERRFHDLANERDRVNRQIQGRVPTAPFVEDTQAWVALTMKRLIRYAVDRGLKRIVWTQGTEQVERYEGALRSQIDTIAWKKTPEGIVIDASQNGTTKLSEKFDPARLHTAVGSQMAQQIINDPNQEGMIKGDNIKLDEVGMTNFYGDAHGMNIKGKPAILTIVANKISKSLGGGEFTMTPMMTEENGNDYKGAPGFDITDKMREAALKGLPLFQGQRGQIAFGEKIRGMPSTITLLQHADLSTFMHESGHFYLEVLSDIASQADAPPEVMADMQKVLAWFGVPDLATWQAMSLEEKRPFHEQFARGFESYLFEGKAPSQELQGLFSRFRAWLLNVYRQITALNVTLTPEVRGVFDRMLATNAEIEDAEAARGYAPLFKSAEEMGATPEEWKAYQEQGLAATQEAIDLLQSRSLRDMKWLSNAKGRILKKLQREAAGKRKAVEDEVTREVRATPIYAALRFLTHGELPEAHRSNAERKLIESFAGQPNKLSIPALKAMYGDGPAAPWRYLNTGKYGHMAAEDGLDPNMVAELFGFTSGDHLVRTILDAEPEASVIQGMTDQRMLERYGDVSSPEAMEDAANEAIHNEARARFIATEVRALSKATGGKKILTDAAKQFAATLIARKKIRDIYPTKYAAAEARSARNAERAKTLTEKATEKRNQLVNHYATKAAYDAVDEVEKAVAYLRRVGDSKTIDPDYRQQIQALLDRYELRPLTNQDARKRETLLAWIDEQKKLGFEPVIDPDLVDEATRKPYREMLLEEFRGLVDAVRNIEHLGRLKHKLLTLQDQREFAAVVGEAAAAIEQNAKRTIKQPLERTKWTKIKSGVAEFFAMHRKFAMMIREMDGHVDNGTLWRMLVRPMNDAGNSEAVMREQATLKLQKLLAPLLKEGKMTEKRFIPEIGESLSREGRIMVALNMGNEGNLQRLLDGDHWTLDQANAILRTLSKTEMDFVQSIWDLVGSYRNEIGAQQKRITGVEPEWVEPRVVQTIHGDYRGGYIPAKYDTSRSTRSLSDEAAQGIMDQWRAKRGAAKTRDSFTKERANKVVDRPLRKDFGVITQHITEVTHRLAWQEYLIDAQRLLRASKIDSAIRDHYGPEVLKSLRDAIEDIAAGEVAAQNAFEAGINYVRTGATIAGLGWRITTALLQPIGLTQSMVRIGPKYVAKGLVEWLGDAAKMENTAKRIFEKSDMMRLRSKTMQREISEIRNKVAGKNSAIEASYFYLITKMQLVADIPTWLGQYHKAVEAGADEKSAVAQADQAVLDAQSGGQIKDLAGIQRGGPMLKLFTNFYSFFNTTYNLTADAVGRTNFRNPLSIGRLAVDLLLLYSVPAALGTLLKAALHSGDDGQDDKKLMRQLIADQLTYLFGTMVGLRELAGAGQTALGLPGDYQGPASVRVFSELAKLGQQANQGEVDEALLKAMNNVAGILFHYPAGQIGATVDGIVTMANGKTNNPGALLVGSNKK